MRLVSNSIAVERPPARGVPAALANKTRFCNEVNHFLWFIAWGDLARGNVLRMDSTCDAFLVVQQRARKELARCVVHACALLPALRPAQDAAAQLRPGECRAIRRRNRGGRPNPSQIGKRGSPPPAHSAEAAPRRRPAGPSGPKGLFGGPGPNNPPSLIICVTTCLPILTICFPILTVFNHSAKSGAGRAGRPGSRRHGTRAAPDGRRGAALRRRGILPPLGFRGTWEPKTPVAGSDWRVRAPRDCAARGLGAAIRQQFLPRSCGPAIFGP